MTTISIDPDSTYTDGGTGNTLNLGNNDTITASGDTIIIAAGDDETITGSNDILNTGAYAGDTIVLGANTSVTDTGSGNTFDMGTGDSVSAVGTFIVGSNAVDTITAPANIWDNSLVLNGGGATVSTILDGDLNAGTRWDIINQSAGQVSDTVNLGLGSSAHFNNTFFLTVSGDGQNGALTTLNCDLGYEIVAEITVEPDTNSQINMIDGDAYLLSILGGDNVIFTGYADEVDIGYQSDLQPDNVTFAGNSGGGGNPAPIYIYSAGETLNFENGAAGTLQTVGVSGENINLSNNVLINAENLSGDNINLNGTGSTFNNEFSDSTSLTYESNNITCAMSGNTITESFIPANISGSGEKITVAAGTFNIDGNDNQISTSDGGSTNCYINVNGNGNDVNFILDYTTINLSADGAIYPINASSNTNVSFAGINNTFTATGNYLIVNLGMNVVVSVYGAENVVNADDGDTVTLGFSASSQIQSYTRNTVNVVADSAVTIIDLDPEATSADAFNLNGSDTVTVSNQNLTVSAAGLSETVIGTGDTIDTLGTGDTITLGANTTLVNYGTGNTINLGPNSQITADSDSIVAASGVTGAVVGGGDTVNGGANAVVTVTGTAGNWDTLGGAGADFTLNGAQANLDGGGATVTLTGSGDGLSLYATDGAWDTADAANAAIVLNSAQVTIYGGGDVLWLNGSGNATSLYGTSDNWDTVNGSGAMLVLNSAQASVSGGNDVLWLNGSGNGVSVYDTAGNWDTVNGSGAEVVVNGAQTSVVGGSDVLWLNGSGDGVSLYDTNGGWDTVHGSNASVVVNAAQASVVGGGETVWLNGAGTAVSLYSTDTNADAVNGSSATLILNGVAATVAGNADKIYLSGNNNLTLNGNSEQMFTAKTLGEDVITGFGSTDHVTFSASDFANFAALMRDSRQSGADTVITLDAGDSITLKNVTASTLTSGQFSFV